MDLVFLLFYLLSIDLESLNYLIWNGFMSFELAHHCGQQITLRLNG